jgi:hypothetical protein
VEIKQARVLIHERKKYCVYLDTVPSPLGVNVLKASFTCTNTEIIIFFSFINIKEVAFKELQTYNTVEECGNATTGQWF